MEKQWTRKWVCMGQECIHYVRRPSGIEVPELYKPEVCVLVKTLHATKLGEKAIFRVPALNKEWIGDQAAMSFAIWDAFMDFPRTETTHWCVTPAYVDETRPVVYGNPSYNQ